MLWPTDNKLGGGHYLMYITSDNNIQKKLLEDKDYFSFFQDSIQSHTGRIKPPEVPHIESNTQAIQVHPECMLSVLNEKPETELLFWPLFSNTVLW